MAVPGVIFALKVHAERSSNLWRERARKADCKIDESSQPICRATSSAVNDSVRGSKGVKGLRVRRTARPNESNVAMTMIARSVLLLHTKLWLSFWTQLRLSAGRHLETVVCARRICARWCACRMTPTPTQPRKTQQVCQVLLVWNSLDSVTTERWDTWGQVA